MFVPSASSTRRMSCLGLFCLLSAGSAGAEIFRVGIGTGCTHLTVEAAVAAAAANGSGFDEIQIAHVTQTLGSLVEVDSHSVALVGGFSSCTAAIPTGQTTLRRSDPTDAFYVHSTTGTSVLSLERITIEMGVSAKRALRLAGDVQALLIDSVLTDGQAPLGEDGGNVWMGGDATLALIRSTIELGEAQGSGGGIYCAGGGTVLVDGSSVLQENKSGNFGGGIFAQGCTLEIRGWIHLNVTSGDGGGIYATGGSSVLLASQGPGDLGAMRSNRAGLDGGGLYLQGIGTTAMARNATIEVNHSEVTGGGVVVAGGATFIMDVDPATCSNGRKCSLLQSNSGGSAGAGAINVTTGSSATIRQTEISFNRASDGIGAVAIVFGTLVIEGCEIFSNDSSVFDDVSRFYVVGSATIAFSTIVEPTEFSDVFWTTSGATFRLLSSIVQADQTFHSPAFATAIDCVITREQASFPAGGTLLTTVTDPTFLFQSSVPFDYRLKRGSIAADYCDTFSYTPGDDDIDNQPRGWDDPTVTGVIGPYDLGADEWRPDIFHDGFESAGTTRWSSAAP